MLQKEITITGIETRQFDGAMKYVLKTTDGNFNFYDTKKDGEQTLAFQQFQEIKPSIGDKITVGFKEEQKNYKGHNYTDRRIFFFATSPQNAPQSPTTSKNQQVAIQPQVNPQTPHISDSSASSGHFSEHSAALKAYLEKLEARVAFLEAESKNHHLRLCHLEDKDKPDYFPLTEKAKETENEVQEVVSLDEIPF
jgi:hypothetical protein